CLFRWAWQIAMGDKTPAGRKQHVIWFLGLLGGLRYVMDGLAHQQTDIVIGALLMGGCLAWTRERPWLAATPLGLAAGCKCTPLLFALYFLWRARWLAAGWLVTVALGVNLLPDLMHSPPRGGSWLSEWFALYLQPMQASNYYPGMWASEPIYNQ